MTSDATLPLDAILTNPETAPRVPVTLAAEAEPYVQALAEALNADPTRAEVLLRYAAAHEGAVGQLLVAALFNLDGRLTPAAIDAALEAFGRQARTLQPLFGVMHDASARVMYNTFRATKDVLQDVTLPRSFALRKRLVNAIDTAMDKQFEALPTYPFPAVLDAAAAAEQGDAAAYETMQAEIAATGDALAAQGKAEALARVEALRERAKFGNPKSKRRKAGKRLL